MREMGGPGTGVRQSRLKGPGENGGAPAGPPGNGAAATGNGRSGTSRLQGWKVISDYLKVDRATAQRWEARGLPVRRIPGGGGRVWAEPDELDAWLLQSEPKPPAAPAPPEQPSRRPRHLFMLAAAAIATLLLALAAWALRPKPVPADLQIANGAIVARDAAGRVLWSHGREGPAAVTRTVTPLWRSWDLDGDGVNELLVFYGGSSLAPGARHFLLCLESDGELRWEFDLEREVRSQAGKTYRWFRPASMLFFPSLRRIVFTTVDYLSYPARIVALDTQGKLQGEYFHSGHLIYAYDFKGLLGRPAVGLTGVDDGRDQATLVVLNPLEMSGASRQPPGDPMQLLAGGPSGREIAVIRFARSRLNAAREEFNFAREVAFAGDEITVSVTEWFSPLRDHMYGVQASSYYQFGPSLRLSGIVLDSGYQLAGRAQFGGSQSPAACRQAEQELLKSGFHIEWPSSHTDH